MNVYVLSADWCKPMPKWFAPVVESPVFATTFKNVPIAGVAFVNPWNAEYSAVPCSTSQFRWDSITVGYGFVSDAAMLAGVHARDLIKIAVARAKWLESALDFPAGGFGPTLKPAFFYVDSTEAGCIMFIAGQAMAGLMARTIWNAPRLFHRNLYAPLLLGAGYAAPAHNAGADYICESLSDPPGTFSSIEAKGRQWLFNPDTSEGARFFLEQGLLQASRTGFVPSRSAFSLATFDASMPTRPVVGQFWDPKNQQATRFHPVFTARLTAQYFEAMLRFLNLFGPPKGGRKNGRELTWDLSQIGFDVRMESDFHSRILRASEGDEAATVFASWIRERDAAWNFQRDDQEAARFNHDGLSLTWIGD